MKRENKDITIMVVPHSQKPPVSFKFPLFLLQCVGFILIFVPILLVSFFNSYNSAKAVFPELEQLRIDNQIKSELIGQLANETQMMLENLKRVQNLERELLELNDIEGSITEPVSPASQKEAPNFRSYLATREYTSIDRTFSGIEVLQTTLPEQEDRMVTLKENIEEQQRREAAIPSRWPTWGGITSGFGWRRHPITRARDFHPAIDIGGSNIFGRPIYATGSGRITYAGYLSTYGKLVIINHGYGYETYYAHQSKIKVKVGDVVEGGSIIGYVGNTGRSTAPHLHYEIRRWGEAVNPVKYLP
ncbi:MAG: peptidoglycan DD-metalloendopeptidase family protein [Eubacteriales bacterium]|nr:peptidoglycan DD-metalloendopeptidase family protein [Eubacteriales bacterium]MDD3073363.1 peptidoglycan DD-metalloendopeptidase family protein [Eubacteriales bacterium]MDD4078976.1 peptidoglycan DD-metalloendopeptidase family protein [Eubacteriales bacterium]